MAVAERARAQHGGDAPLPRHVARLVRVPVLLAVVAERRVAAVALALEARAAGAAAGDHRVPVNNTSSHQQIVVVL